MPKYKYILFDLDGTLDDPFEGITKGVEYAMKKFGVEADRSKLGCFIGPPLAESFSKYFGLSEADADCTIRMSLCKDNTREDIDTFAELLASGIQRLVKIKR